MAYQSVVDKVLARIYGGGKGRVFSAIDLLDLGSRNSIHQALSRLAKSGEIRRLDHGLYHYPRVNKRIGPLSPSPEEIARAIARKSSSEVQPSGAQSANTLGLSTQVPSRLIYRMVGVGPSRKIRTGRQVLEFRRTSPNKLEGAGTPARAVIEALRHIGKKNISDAHLETIGESLSPTDIKDLQRLKKRAPGWMHLAIDQILSASSQ